MTGCDFHRRSPSHPGGPNLANPSHHVIKPDGLRFYREAVRLKLTTVVAGCLQPTVHYWYVNWSPDPVALVPPGAVTVMSTVPLPVGAVAVISVSETTVKLVAAVVPNSTAVAPVKPVPVIVTVVPPATGPLFGLMLVTIGDAS